MRLVDLHPEWLTANGENVGVTFDCPLSCCAEAPQARIVVGFKSPQHYADGTPHPNFGDGGWRRVPREVAPGEAPPVETFETLTLRPAIERGSHLKFFVINGDVTPA